MLRKIITAPVYAVLWLLALLIVAVVAAAVQLDFLVRPTRRVRVPEGTDPAVLAAALRRFWIKATVQGQYVAVAARDAEMAREWAAHLAKWEDQGEGQNGSQHHTPQQDGTS